MAITCNYDRHSNIYYYEWALGSNRPAAPTDFSQTLFDRFISSHYAENTTLRTFLMERPNGWSEGVLNQLHRRHIISWDKIKKYTLCAAISSANRDLKSLQKSVFDYFNINPTLAWNEPHGVIRAQYWTTVAEYMCWNVNNVFIGPSYGNVGTDLDLANGVDDNLLLGTVWQGAITVFAQMDGFIRAHPDREDLAR
jgi:hypothetical protein